MSAMEHLVPEMMFSTEENPAHGISAVKALQLAAAEGQKIWTITQANLTVALAAINMPSDIETDIRNSVNAGMEVTAHEAAVDFFGSSQVGYIVLDPEIRAGGYLIGGGENGGVLIMIGLMQILFSAIALLLMGPHMWTFMASPAGQYIMTAVFLSAISVIARGIEIMTKGSGYSCNTANGGAAAAFGSLLSLWIKNLEKSMYLLLSNLAKFGGTIGTVVGTVVGVVLPCNQW
jgi:hypothetical protein